MNPYKILGLGEYATLEEVKLAYRRLAQRLHPDKNDHVNAEAAFKEVKAAYELIESGTWERAPPKKHEPPVSPANYEHIKFSCTFKDTFLGSLLQVPGTPYFIKVPYGVNPGTRMQLQGKTAYEQTATFDITFNVYDPSHFYTVEQVKGKQYLSCRVITSAAALLAGSSIVLPNINPKMSSFEITLRAATPIIVPYAGLQAIGGGRDSLRVHVETIYKDLKDERYDVLQDLQTMVSSALRDYKDAVF